MSAEAIAILEEARRAIDEVAAATALGERDFEAERKLEAELIQVGPFNDIFGLWLTHGSGGGSVMDGRIGGWCWRQLAAGRPASEIVKAAAEEIERNSAFVMEITPVKGIKVDEPTTVGVEAMLVPPEFVPPGRHRDWLVTDPLFGDRIRVDHAILLQGVTVKPALTRRDSPEFTEVTDRLCREVDERTTFRRTLRRALAITGGGPVEMPGWCLTVVEDCLLAFGGSAYGQSSPKWVGSARYFDRDELMKNLGLLTSFQHRKALEVIIDRLLASRTEDVRIDQLIDLGMAMEMALMHGASDGRGEIRYKISNRAGWLLGGDQPKDRRAASAYAKRLYDARSVAVHVGTVSTSKSVDFDASDAFVQGIVHALLRLGRFPDWEALTFGEQLKSKP